MPLSLTAVKWTLLGKPYTHIRHRSAEAMPTSAMPTVHTIRLRGPWGCQPLARYVWDTSGQRVEIGTDLPPAGRLTMPADWSTVCGRSFDGRVLFRRRFHWPARLLPRERVWLVFDEVHGRASVRLNERFLGEVTAVDRPAEFDITEQLEPTNVLLVEVSTPEPDLALDRDSDPQAGGLTGEVRLEVRSVTRPGASD